MLGRHLSVNRYGYKNLEMIAPGQDAPEACSDDTEGDLQSLLDLPTSKIFGRWLFFFCGGGGVAGNLVSSVPQAYSIFLIFSKQKATSWFIVYGVWWRCRDHGFHLPVFKSLPHPHPVTVDWCALFSVSVSVSME